MRTSVLRQLFLLLFHSLTYVLTVNSSRQYFCLLSHLYRTTWKAYHNPLCAGQVLAVPLITAQLCVVTVTKSTVFTAEGGCISQREVICMLLTSCGCAGDY